MYPVYYEAARSFARLASERGGALSPERLDRLVDDLLGALAAALSRPHPPHEAALLVGAYMGGGGAGIVVSGLAVPWVLSRTGPAGWPAG